MKKQPQPQDPSDKLFDTMFEFKMMAKSMERESKKSDAQSKNLIKKVKACIAKGDYDQAKVAASDAIRQKNMVKRYRVLSSKIDAVAQKLKSAYQNQKLSEQITSLTQQLVGANNMMDIVKIRQDSAHLWSQLMYVHSYDKLRLKIICEKIDNDIDRYFSKYDWYKNYYNIYQLMNMLRILQYAKEKSNKQKL